MSKSETATKDTAADTADKNVARLAALFHDVVKEAVVDGRVVCAIDYDALKRKLSGSTL